jgi:hypothetical protein
MRSAPHTGKKMCEVPASTPIRFINRASHGPHHYARVEVNRGKTRPLTLGANTPGKGQGAAVPMTVRQGLPLGARQT